MELSGYCLKFKFWHFLAVRKTQNVTILILNFPIIFEGRIETFHLND